MFLIPYFAVTAYAIALNLNYGSDMGAALFVPLTDRVLNIPPPEKVIPPDPFVNDPPLAGRLCLGSGPHPVLEDESAADPVLLAFARVGARIARLPARLPGRLLLSSSQRRRRLALPNGGATTIPASETFSFSFFSGPRDLRAITFNVISGQTLQQASVTDGAGTVLAPERTLDIRPGADRVAVGEVAEAQANLLPSLSYARTTADHSHGKCATGGAASLG